MSLRARAIEKKAESRAAPIIRSECERLNIKRIPPIEWRAGIRVRGDVDLGGTYSHLSQRIYINSNKTEKRLDKGMPEGEIIHRTMHTIFHELKHYLDHRSHDPGMRKYRQNPDKYEAGAEEYADEMME